MAPPIAAPDSVVGKLANGLPQGIVDKLAMGDLGLDQLENIISGRAQPVAEVPATPAAPAAPAEPAAAEPVTPAEPAPAEPATPDAAPAEPVTPDSDAAPVEPVAADPASEVLPKTMRMPASARLFEVKRLMNEEGLTEQQAITRVYPTDAKPTEGTPAAPATPGAPIVDAQVSDYDAKIADAGTKITALIAQRKAARADADHDRADDLNDQISVLTAAQTRFEGARDRYVENQQAQAESAAKAKVIAVENADKAKAVAEFPWISDKAHANRKGFDAFVAQAVASVARGEQEYAGMFDANGAPLMPAWRTHMAREYAAQNNLPRATQAPAAKPGAPAPRQGAPSGKPQAQPRAPAASVLSSGKPGQSSTFEGTQEDFRKLADKLTPAEVNQLLRAG